MCECKHELQNTELPASGKIKACPIELNPVASTQMTNIHNTSVITERSIANSHSLHTYLHTNLSLPCSAKPINHEPACQQRTGILHCDERNQQPSLNLVSIHSHPISSSRLSTEAPSRPRPQPSRPPLQYGRPPDIPQPYDRLADHL